MPDYQQGKIYKIVCNESGDVYYGSTTKKRLCDRIGGHRSDYKRYLKGLTTNVTSFQIIEKDNYYYALVETFPCNSADELRARERHWIENNECINKQIPNRTRKETTQNYWKTHKEERVIKQKEYRINNPETWQQYYSNNREKLIQYQKDNYERKNELSRIRYNANKDEINRKRREKAQLKREESK